MAFHFILFPHFPFLVSSHSSLVPSCLCPGEGGLGCAGWRRPRSISRRGKAEQEEKERSRQTQALNWTALDSLSTTAREQDSWTARELERKTARDDEIKLESKLDLADAGKLHGNLVLKTQIWMQSAQWKVCRCFSVDIWSGKGQPLHTGRLWKLRVLSFLLYVKYSCCY